MEIGRGDQAKVQEIPVVGRRWAEMQGKPSAELGRCSGRFPEVQGGFQKCRAREARRLAEMQADHTGRLETVQENGGLQLAEEPGRMQEQGRSCKQGCSGSLGPYGFRPGSSIGLPPGKGGPKAAPNRKKSLVMQGKASHLYTVGEEMVGRRETRKQRSGAGLV